MPISYTPKKESEIKRFAVLEPGDYPFTVLGSLEQPSKSAKNKGKIMCAVKLNVHGPDGQDRHVYNYFADWFSEWLLKHFMETTGHAAEYLSGNVDSTNDNWAGWQGYVRLKIKNDPQYGEKNVVDDYLPQKGQTVEDLDFANPTAASEKPKVAASKPAVDDSDVPF